VRDLHVEPVAKPKGRGKGAAAVADPKPKPKPKAPAPDSSADALPEDVVMPHRPEGGSNGKSKRSAAAKRRSKHGRPR
jgi:hypothetical protein